MLHRPAGTGVRRHVHHRRRTERAPHDSHAEPFTERRGWGERGGSESRGPEPRAGPAPAGSSGSRWALGPRPAWAPNASANRVASRAAREGIQSGQGQQWDRPPPRLRGLTRAGAGGRGSAGRPGRRPRGSSPPSGTARAARRAGAPAASGTTESEVPREPPQFPRSVTQDSQS